MAFSKITDEERQGKGNVGQPDTPSMSTAEMQELLDELPNLAIDGFNRFVDEITDETGAASIGASVPDGITANPNVASILTGIAFTLGLCNESRHNHLNKAVIDQITAEYKEEIDTLMANMDGITFSTVISSLSTDEQLATAKAVYTALQNLNINTKAINAAYPVGTVYSTTLLVEPATIFGVGTWVLLDSEQVGVQVIKRYMRTA